MKHCLELAVKGLGKTAPNPMVGCVIVHNGQLIGEGYHEEYGQAHAEVNAINSVKDKSLLKDSTLYVNLEPCSHYGKTPPCADLIVEHRLRAVVIGSIDTNSQVSGKGIEKLVKAGIDVKVGILEEQCRDLNKRFYIYHEKKRPYIILKWAQTADGFIDIKRKEESTSRPVQISNSDSKKLLHLWRSQEQAIMIGTNTALLDNPQLTVREVNGKNPLRVTIDKWLRIPKHFHLYDKSTPTLIFTSAKAENMHNVEFRQIDFEKPVIPQILHDLYERGISSVMIEGGEHLLNSFIDSGLWDSARVFISEKTIGKGVPAPVMKIKASVKENISGDKLLFYQNTNHLSLK